MSEYGVYAGQYNSKPAYVGRVLTPGLIMIGIIRHKSEGIYCIEVGYGQCLDQFQYLYRTDEVSYIWINSNDGKEEENAVNVTNSFGTFAIGKYHYNSSQLTIGIIYPGYGLATLLFSSYVRDYYQVLVRVNGSETTVPTEEPITYPIDNSTTTEPPQNCRKLNLTQVCLSAYLLS
jgi:hypothetical protein